MSRRSSLVALALVALVAVLVWGRGLPGLGAGAEGVATTAPSSTAATTATSTTPDSPSGTVGDTVDNPALDTVAPDSTGSSAVTTTEALPTPAPPPDPHAPEPIDRIGTVEMPTIGVSKPIFEGVSLTVLDHGPGHWPGTAMPGHRGNAVIAGHRASHDHPFRHIDQLAPGDPVVVTTDEGRFVYRVVSTEVVKPNAVWIIDQSDGFTATLFACHPPGSTRERIVVHLRLEP